MGFRSALKCLIVIADARDVQHCCVVLKSESVHKPLSVVIPLKCPPCRISSRKVMMAERPVYNFDDLVEGKPRVCQFR